MTALRNAAAIGGGVIGAGWVARLLENGIDVAIYDPAPEAARRLQAVLDNAERAYAKLTLAPRPKKGALSFRPSIAETVEGAEMIVESVPARLDMKQVVYAAVEAAADRKAIVATPTSGILLSQPQAARRHPERPHVQPPLHPAPQLP